jgi:hypothetical protein
MQLREQANKYSLLLGFILSANLFPVQRLEASDACGTFSRIGKIFRRTVAPPPVNTTLENLSRRFLEEDGFTVDRRAQHYAQIFFGLAARGLAQDLPANVSAWPEGSSAWLDRLRRLGPGAHVLAEAASKS